MIKRNTIQRSLVFEAVNQLKCHATADEIYDKIVKEHPHVSRATVYRNLNLLSEMGEIRKVEIPGGADRFDHLTREHAHIQCEKCGRLFDVNLEPFADLQKRMKDADGFVITGCSIVLRGICPACQQASDSQNC